METFTVPLNYNSAQAVMVIPALTCFTIGVVWQRNTPRSSHYLSQITGTSSNRMELIMRVAYNTTIATSESFHTCQWIFSCRNNFNVRSEEHTSELQSRPHLVCRLL